MQLSIGFSPCPNDTFMVEALLHGRVPSQGIAWATHIEDVETLNTWALEGKLDVTKVSFATWLHIRDHYTLLPAGAALGHGCGPLVIARSEVSEQEIIAGPVAIPGQLTTAHLLFNLRYPKAEDKRMMLFSEIEQAVLNGNVCAGVIIHENRFTYASRGLVKIVDLGEFWEETTGSPIPLGAYVAKTSLGADIIQQVGGLLRASVAHAFAFPGDSRNYVRVHAQELEDSVIASHIHTYVNEFSLDLGDQGLRAVDLLQNALVAGSLA